MTALLYATLAAIFTIVGGSLPLVRRNLSGRLLSLLIAFSAGVLLSAGLNEMMPESFELAGKTAAVGVSAGFILLYLSERVTMVHSCREQGCEVHPFGFFAIAGIGFHTALDGFAIAVSSEVGAELGAVVAIAVLAHRFPSGISFAGVMLACGYTRQRAWVTLMILGALAIVGAGVGLLFRDVSVAGLGFAIGLSAGSFLYISTSDLLPIAHEHSWGDYGVPLSFASGFGIMLAAALALH
ncbi:MAG: ZIP family metal transporter [Thermoleophilia bacterium]